LSRGQRHRKKDAVRKKEMGERQTRDKRGREIKIDTDRKRKKRDSQEERRGRPS
jgi:hypothetical protein